MVESASLLASYFLAGLFVLAAATKIINARDFRARLTSWHLPNGVVSAAAVLAPVAEVLAGSALFLAPGAPVSVLTAMSLLVAFSGVVFMNREKLADCSCFGAVLPPMGWRNAMTRNAVLVAIAGASIFTSAAPSPVLAIAVLAIVASLLVMSSWLQSRGQKPTSVTRPDQISRRGFLTKAALVTGSATAIAFRLAGTRSAEAACYDCGSCSNSYVWIGCNGNCCASFWVIPRKYCNGSCYSACGQYIQEFCGYAECC